MKQHHKQTWGSYCGPKFPDAYICVMVSLQQKIEFIIMKNSTEDDYSLHTATSKSCGQEP